MLFGKANPTRRRMIRVTASLNEAVLNIFKFWGPDNSCLYGNSVQQEAERLIGDETQRFNAKPQPPMVTSDDSDDSDESNNSTLSEPKAKRQKVTCSSPNAPSQKPYLDTQAHSGHPTTPTLSPGFRASHEHRPQPYSAILAEGA